MTALWLERIAAGVLWLVLAALGWMVCVAYAPAWGRVLSEEAEVVILLVLLTGALLLVSVVALWHTRA
jgi:hypothetical protein